MKIIKASVSAPYAAISIVISRFNDFINNKLLDGAIDILERIGQVSKEKITVVWVPGAYELPLITKILVESKKYDAIIALATVIKGDTTHSEHIARECSSNLSRIIMNNNVPITFGILTTDSIEKAIERAGTKFGNKGSEAALSALEMINIINIINSNI